MLPAILGISNEFDADYTLTANDLFVFLNDTKLCTKLFTVSIINALITSSANPGYSPSVRLLVLIVQRLESLILLEFAELSRVAELKERWGKFYQPFRVNRCYFSHVLFGGLY